MSVRALILIPLAAMLAGCLAPGERDPTRYPWDARNRPALSAVPHPPVAAGRAISPIANPQPPVVPPPGTYCVVALAPRGTTGITFTGNAAAMSACSAPADPAPNPATPR